MGTHSRDGDADLPVLVTDDGRESRHPASRMDAGRAREAHTTAIELQGAAGLLAAEQARAARHRRWRRRVLWSAVLACLLAVLAAATFVLGLPSSG